MSCLRTHHGVACGDQTQDLLIRSLMLYHYATALPKKNDFVKTKMNLMELVSEFLSLCFSYMFLEYSSPVHAQQAVKMTNGYKLDKAHTFAVNLFSDYEK